MRPDKSSKPLEGAILCCTSIPPDERVGIHTSARARPLRRIHVSVTSWLTRIVHIGRTYGTDGSAAQTRPDIRRYPFDCWRDEYPEVQVCREGTPGRQGREATMGGGRPTSLDASRRGGLTGIGRTV